MLCPQSTMEASMEHKMNVAFEVGLMFCYLVCISSCDAATSCYFSSLSSREINLPIFKIKILMYTEIIAMRFKCK